MAAHGLGAVEARFADLIWENEPIGSGELVKLCNRELNWKKPTTSDSDTGLSDSF